MFFIIFLPFCMWSWLCCCLALCAAIASRPSIFLNRVSRQCCSDPSEDPAPGPEEEAGGGDEAAVDPVAAWDEVWWEEWCEEWWWWWCPPTAVDEEPVSRVRPVFKEEGFGYAWPLIHVSVFMSLFSWLMHHNFVHDRQQRKKETFALATQTYHWILCCWQGFHSDCCCDSQCHHLHHLYFHRHHAWMTWCCCCC